MPHPLDDDLGLMRERCGLLDRGDRTAGGADLLRMTGADRGRFLHGLVTSDVKTLTPGTGAYGFITNIKGRVLADLATLALDDAFWLVLPSGQGETMAQHLGRYKIADRVEIAALEAGSLGLIGLRAADILAELGVEDPPAAPWHHQRAMIAGQAVLLVREPDLGVPCYGLWLSAAVGSGAQPTVAQALVTLGQALLAADPALREVSAAAVDALRISAGRARFGHDFGDDCFPQETGLGDEAVSYTKGCYLGQEVVARIHYRGGVNRHLRGVVLPLSDPTSLAGRALLHDGREAGRLTSVAPIGDQLLGLAILHKRAEPGSTVIVEGSAEGAGRGRVVELPFP